MLNIVFALVLSTIAILWTLPLILGHVFGLQLFRITASSKVMQVLNKLPKRATILEDDRTRGFIYGWPYIGYINESTSSGSNGSTKSTELYVFTTHKFYNAISDQNNADKKDFITIYERQNNFFCLDYIKRQFDCTRFIPYTSQAHAILAIKSVFHEKKSCVCILWGQPGSRKSMIGTLLAKELKGSYCDSSNFTDPGDNLALIYNIVNPSDKNPLVIMMEEFDVIINKIHNGQINPHRHIPVQITSKTTWNTFFDKIDRGLYPHLILLLTSNKNPTEIDKLDSSYIRDGRVNLRIEIKKDIEIKRFNVRDDALSLPINE